ncbi:MAG: response regulator [Ruminococcus sp.]|nr:response regulator [Ruminococcus sp.]
MFLLNHNGHATISKNKYQLKEYIANLDKYSGKADLLELEVIESEHARNGKEAVQMFSYSDKGYYDAILMDVRMPEMDGLTATRTIRALDRPDAKTIPIIAMTANVFDEDIERSLQAGMNAHLSKPIEPEKIYETISRLISESDKTN